MATFSEATGVRIPTSRWWRVGIILFLVYLVAFAERSNIGVAAPAIGHQLGLSATFIGVLLSAFFWGYIITQVPGGWLSSKVGPVRVIASSLVIWGVVSILQSTAGSLGELLVYRTVMGLAEGVLWPSFGVMFTVWFTTSERSRASGLALLALPLSSVVAVPSAGWLVGTWSWQVMFIVQGIPAFIMAAVVIIFLRDDPTDDKRLSSTELSYILSNRARRSAGSEATSFLTVLKSPAVWACCVVYFLWLTGFYSFGLWLPTIVKQLSSSGIAKASYLTVIPFLIAGIALVANSWAADRSRRSKTPYVVVPFAIGAIALLTQQVLPSSLAIQIVFLVIAGIGLYASFGPWWGWALERLPAEQAGPGYGLINVFGSFGGIVGPIIVGAAAGASGKAVDGLYGLGFFLIAAILVGLGIAKWAPIASSGAVEGQSLGVLDDRA